MGWSVRFLWRAMPLTLQSWSAPFFEYRGYRVIREQQVERRGVRLTNFVMRKERKDGSKSG